MRKKNDTKNRRRSFMYSRDLNLTNSNMNFILFLRPHTISRRCQKKEIIEGILSRLFWNGKSYNYVLFFPI